MKAIITGGSSLRNNLGDQAMILTLIEYLKANRPDIEPVAMDENAWNDRDFTAGFDFRILPDIPMVIKLREINRFLHILLKLARPGRKFSAETEDAIIREYRECDVIFQVAGFGISSQMPFLNCLSRIWDIALARKLKKKLIMLPQSFGPFDYKGLKKIIFGYYIRKYINYPEFVLCREEYGKKLLDGIGCTKARLEHDIVLSRPADLDSKKIYKDGAKTIPKKPDIDRGRDLLVVPNFRLVKYRSIEEVCDIFEKAIKTFTAHTGGKAYIFRHTFEDEEIARLIYNRFDKNERVVLCGYEYDCIETESLFSQFSVGLVSRWHANVHAIRAGLPYVIIGWAEKYRETAGIFNNADVVFDIREPLAAKSIGDALIRVYNKRWITAERINSKEDEIKKTFCLGRVLNDI
ncbi:MAG: polysaccharide pyruvyl transferase family protein [Clostridia bacterium]